MKFKAVTVILIMVIAIQAVAIIFLSLRVSDLNRRLPRMRRAAPKAAVSPVAARKPAEFKGRIAIVIDDLGYNANNLELFKKLRYPVTVAVLPNLAYSSLMAAELRGQGREVILHLPMEPWEKSNLEKETVMTAMPSEEVLAILRNDYAGVGNISGVSNHMGSRATENPALMQVVFKELGGKRLYFLDSYVSARSVCSGLAEKNGVVFYRRDVFLDNRLQPEYIKKQIEKLKFIARRRGQSIGIGHDRRITLEVLAEVMPEMVKEGYRFVFVSRLSPAKNPAGNED